MTVGVFLDIQTIKDSVNQHARLMSNRLGMQVVSAVLYQKDCTRIGFTVSMPKGLCHITMPYEQDEFGDYAILREEWLVESKEHGIKQDGFKILGDAMDYIILQLLKEKDLSEFTKVYTVELYISEDISFIVNVKLDDNPKHHTESIIVKLAKEKLSEQNISGYHVDSYEIK